MLIPEIAFLNKATKQIDKNKTEMKNDAGQISSASRPYDAKNIKAIAGIVLNKEYLYILFCINRIETNNS